MRICPKCNYQRTSTDYAPDYECPKCGIIYDRVNRKKNLENNKPETVRNPTPTPKSKENLILKLSTERIIITSMLILFLLFVAYSLSTTSFVLEVIYSSEIEVCHNGVYKQAKYSSEIVSTNISKSHGLSFAQVDGRAKFQNGYGAWTQYEYICLVSKGAKKTLATLTEGWD